MWWEPLLTSLADRCLAVIVCVHMILANVLLLASLPTISVSASGNERSPSRRLLVKACALPDVSKVGARCAYLVNPCNWRLVRYSVNSLPTDHEDRGQQRHKTETARFGHRLDCPVAVQPCRSAVRCTTSPKVLAPDP